MRNIKTGCKGQDVQNWQQYLRGLQIKEDGDSSTDDAGDAVIADGIFGPATDKATKAWQAANGLATDGIVGPKTWALAVSLGYPQNAVATDVTQDQDVPTPDPAAVTPTDDASTVDKSSPNWPPRPADAQPLVTNDQRAAIFGKFAYVNDPSPSNPERIKITDNWPSQNIQHFHIPQLEGVTGAPSNGMIAFHKLAGAQFQAWFAAIEARGLKDRIISFAGSWVPRYVRGSKTKLSNHAWGTALDINVPWNRRGHQSALLGEKGCVRELAEICYDFGLFWGGHYQGAPEDGMHTEARIVLTPDELAAAKIKYGIA